MTTCLDLKATSSKAQTFVDVAILRAIKQQDHIAYRFLSYGLDNENSREKIEELTITYAELDQRARAIATSLQDLKLHQKPVLLLYPPSLDYICTLLGCLYAGAIAVPVSPSRNRTNLTRLSSIAKDCKANVLLTHRAVWNKFQNHPLAHNAFNTLDLYTVLTNDVDLSIGKNWFGPRLRAEDIAVLQYTSGSTGSPKGVMLSHHNMLQNSEAIYRCFRHSQQSHALGWLPPHDNMGLMGNIFQPLYGGFPSTLFSPTNFFRRPLRWLQAISHYGATTSGGPNFAYDLCIKRVKPQDLATLDLSNWRVAFNGAEPVRFDTLKRFTATFASCGFRPETFYPCYGLAESTLMVSGGKPYKAPNICHVDTAGLKQGKVLVKTKPQASTRTLVSCGYPQTGGKVWIVNPQSNSLCLEETVGEIWLATSSVSQGYWQRLEQTQAVFQAQIPGDESGPFLRTGDLGFIRNGELYITGHIKELMMLQGQTYYPQDIELTVAQSHPILANCAGAAFSMTDTQGNEHLIIVQEIDCPSIDRREAKAVVSQLLQAVSDNHCLPVYAVALLKPGTIPKTTSGKICRRASRLAFLSGQLAVIHDWSESPWISQRFQTLQYDVNQLFAQLLKAQQLQNAVRA